MSNIIEKIDTMDKKELQFIVKDLIKAIFTAKTENLKEVIPEIKDKCPSMLDWMKNNGLMKK